MVRDMFLRGMPLIALLLVSLLGYVELLSDRRKTQARRDYAVEFLDKFRQFGNGLMSNNMSGDLYQWLMLKSARMQAEMGQFGIATVQPPRANYIVQSYQIVVNGLSRIRELFDQYRQLSFGLTMSGLYDEIRHIDDALLRYIGAMDTMEKITAWGCFTRGLTMLLALPVWLVTGFGLLNRRTYMTVRNGPIVKVITLVVTVLGLISSVITIVAGYSTLTGIINHIVRWKLG